jgi:hypothetical protein
MIKQISSSAWTEGSKKHLPKREFATGSALIRKGSATDAIATGWGL